MKKSLVLSLVLLCCLRLSAAEPAAPYTVSVDLPYVSRYIFRGLEISRNRFQPSVTVTAGNFNGGVWTNQPFARTADSEADLFANYDVPITKDWKSTLGACVYHYPRADTSSGDFRTTFEPKLAFAGPLGPLTSSLSLFYDTKLKTPAMEGMLGYSTTVDRATFDVGTTAGQVRPDGGDTYSYWGLTTKVSYKAAEKIVLYCGLNYASHNLAGAGKNLLYGTAGVTLAF